MTIEQVRDLCEARPFTAFQLHLPDGRCVEVVHPDFFSTSKTGRLLFVSNTDGSESIVDLLLVSDVTVNAAPLRPGGNR